MIRGWRVRPEGSGYVCYFDPSFEHVVLHEGPDLVYEVREGREAGEAGARSQVDNVMASQIAMFSSISEVS